MNTWLDEVKDFFAYMAPLLIVLVIISAVALGAVFSIASVLGERSCDAKWVDFEHEYALFGGGCRVQVDGTWYPSHAVIKVVEDE